jgi:hypothetical protein
MKFSTIRASALVALVAACASVSIGACTSTTSSPAGDGGSGSGSGSSSGGSSPSDYCSLYSSYITKCDITDACQVAQAQSCSTLAAALSSAYLGVAVSCASGASCGDAGTDAISACIEAKSAALTPDVAQDKFAADYCGNCAPAFSETTGQCLSAFFAGTQVATAEGGTGFTPGDFGSFVIELNDTNVAAIDTACVAPTATDGGANGCIDTFSECVSTQLNTLVPTPAACETQGDSFGFHHLSAN